MAHHTNSSLAVSQSDAQSLYISALADLFIPTPTRLPWETFSHSDIIVWTESNGMITNGPPVNSKRPVSSFHLLFRCEVQHFALSDKGWNISPTCASTSLMRTHQTSRMRRLGAWWDISSAHAGVNSNLVDLILIDPSSECWLVLERKCFSAPWKGRLR